MEESSGLTEEALAQYDREMADTRGRRFYRRRTRKARRSIVSAMSDNESDSDDEASSDGASPRDNIALGNGEHVFKIDEVEESEARNIERENRRSMCSDTKEVAIPLINLPKSRLPMLSKIGFSILSIKSHLWSENI